MRLGDGAHVVAAGAATSTSSVVTVAGSAAAATSLKVTPHGRLPRTGRDGVECGVTDCWQRRLPLIGGWVGQVAGLLPGGKPLPLPEPDSPGCLRREEPRGEDPVGSAVSGRAGPACSSPEPHPWQSPGRTA